MNLLWFNNFTLGTQLFGIFLCFGYGNKFYYIAESVSGQDEVNPVF